MSPSGAEVIRQIKSQIEEVDPSEVNAAVSNGNGSRPVLIDVRERGVGPGHIPGAGTSRAAISSRASRARSGTARSASSSTAPPATARRSPPTRCASCSATRT